MRERIRAYCNSALKRSSLGRKYQPHPAAPGRRVEVDGRSFHALVAGTGHPTVVFESGLSRTALDWALVQPEVAKFTTTVAYDRGGYGWSSPGPRPRSPTRLVAEAHALLLAMGVPSPYVLVGHSYGGLLVQLFAALHPNDVAGMVLVESVHEDQRRLLPRRRWQDRGREALAWQWYRTMPVRARIRALGIGGAPTLRVPNEYPTELVDAYGFVESNRRAYDWIFGEALAIPSAEKELRGIVPATFHGPMRVLTAGRVEAPLGVSVGQMQAFSLWLARDLTRRSDLGHLEVVAQAGHMIHLERPDAVISAVIQVVGHVRSSEVEVVDPPAQ